MILFDTTMLIDLEREYRRQVAGPAASITASMTNEQPAVSAVTAGEFAEGFDLISMDFFQEMMSAYTVIDIDTAIAWRYGMLSKNGRKQGDRIGSNDLWIAATAIEWNIPLLTRNLRHFSRIPELELKTYR